MMKTVLLSTGFLCAFWGGITQASDFVDLQREGVDEQVRIRTLVDTDSLFCAILYAIDISEEDKAAHILDAPEFQIYKQSFESPLQDPEQRGEALRRIAKDYAIKRAEALMKDPTLMKASAQENTTELQKKVLARALMEIQGAGHCDAITLNGLIARYAAQ